MKKILPILGKIGAVIQGLMLFSMFLMNGLMGYIMFAPDDLPKPFYLSYAGEVPAIAAQFDGGDGHGSSDDGAGGHSEGAAEVIYLPGQGVMVETGTKIVNLADPGGRRYLKSGVTIEVNPPPHEAASGEATAESGDHSSGAAAADDPVMIEFNDKMSKRLPIINDIITTILSGKTFDQVYTVDGKEALRQEIMAELNHRLPDLKVIAVYFTEFVVQ
jgi:flagellar FliL protein